MNVIKCNGRRKRISRSRTAVVQGDGLKRNLRNPLNCYSIMINHRINNYLNNFRRNFDIII